MPRAASTPCCFTPRSRTPSMARASSPISPPGSAAAAATGRWPLSPTRRSRESASGSVPGAGVVCGLSGGVDSTVAALLVHRAVGDRLTCIFVDNGLLRLNEAAQVEERFSSRMSLPLVCEDASEQFVGALAGVTDPERKRKIIGSTFIDVFESVSRPIGQLRLSRTGHVVSRRHRERVDRRSVGRHQEPSQRGGAAGAPAVPRWSSRCASCSRTRSDSSAGSWASTMSSSGASRSRAPGSRCASWAR